MARKKQETWEEKDRVYQYIGSDGRDAFPTSFELRIHSTPRNQLIYNDNGTNRSIRYCVNQESPFQDEQKGESTLGRVTFFNGRVTIPKSQRTLQKLLSIYHPYLGKKYRELDPEADAKKFVETEQNYYKAAEKIFNSKDVELRAVGRVILGKGVATKSASTIKGDLLSRCKDDNDAVLSVINLFGDSDLMLKELAYRAVDAGQIKISEDKSKLLDSSNKKIAELEFDEDPYHKIVLWFKNKEGRTMKEYLEDKLK